MEVGTRVGVKHEAGSRGADGAEAKSTGGNPDWRPLWLPGAQSHFKETKRVAEINSMASLKALPAVAFQTAWESQGATGPVVESATKSAP